MTNIYPSILPSITKKVVQLSNSVTGGLGGGGAAPESSQVIVASRSSAYTQSVMTDSGAKTYRTIHTITYADSSLKVQYGNFNGNTIYNGVIDATLDGFTLIASLDYGGTIYPLTFGGNSSVHLEPGETATSDAVSIPGLTVGAALGSRAYVVGDASGNWPLGWVGFISGEGTSSGNQTANAGASFSAARVYGPMAILGTVTTRPKTIAIIGNSIAAGYNDGINSSNNVKPGFILRAINNQHGYAYLPLEGSSAQQFAGTNNRQFSALFFPYCTAAVYEYGTNDFGIVATRTAAQVLADAQTVWAALVAAGVTKIVACTVMPQTTRTAPNEAQRVIYNNLLRDNWESYGLNGIWDVADAVETARDSGTWIGGYTGDGLHPNATGHAAASAVCDLSKLD